jgi:hypothetical protein
MEELFNLTYKDEVEAIKDEENFETLGDEKYIFHEDMEARLYWAFCRPSGSHPNQIKDPHPLVSIMAFNHSRLGALERFKILNPEVIKDDELRKKIRNRTRMLFRDLVDNDFSELNQVLELVPVFLSVAIDQLINGRLWNDIVADEVEASRFIKQIQNSQENITNDFLEALYRKLANFDEFDSSELKDYLNKLLGKKDSIDKIILEYYKEKTFEYTQMSDLHILQKKGLEKLASNLLS